MANYNGLVASLAQTRVIGVSFVSTIAAVPAKFFESGQFGVVVTDGVSGAFSVDVIGGIGGASFIIAGRTNINAVGSYPVPLLVYGQSGTFPNLGIPRPRGVNFTSVGTTWGVGFTASVFLAGAYN